MYFSPDQSTLRLGLSRRVANALYRAGIKTLEKLAQTPAEQLACIFGIGESALAEITELLNDLDIQVEEPPNQNGNDDFLSDKHPGISPHLGINTLPLSSRTRRTLYRCGVRTSGDLLSMSFKELETFCGLGRAALEEVERFLNLHNGYSEPQETPTLYPLTVPQKEPLDLQAISEETLLDKLMAGVSERNRDVTSYRYGLAGRDPHTLQETGDFIGVTRERARQICSATIRTNRRNLQRSLTIQAFIGLCRDYLLDCRASTTEELAHYLEDRINVLDVDHMIGLLDFLNDVVLDIERDKFGFKVYKALICAVDLNPNAVLRATIALQSYLQDSMAPTSFETILEYLTANFHEIPADTKLVLALLQHHEDFVQNETGEWGLQKWRNRLYDDIVMVLRELGRPAHFTEITELLNQRLPDGEEAQPHSIHAQLGRYTNLFIRTDSGTFGLREQFPDAPIQPPKYIDLMEEVFEEAGVPLSVQDVYERVNVLREAKYSSMMIYLGTHEKFMSYGNGMYGLAKWGSGKEATADGYVFTYCPTPLLPANDNSRSFFETIFVGYNLLIENPDLMPEAFYQAMLEWADQTTKGNRDAQSAFDTWYAAGLLDYVDFAAGKHNRLMLQLPPGASVPDIRAHCLSHLCRRIQRMPELLMGIEKLPSPTVPVLQQVVFGEEDRAFDIRLRLSLLLALEAVRQDKGNWRITDTGRAALAANPPQNSLDFSALDNLGDTDSESDYWDDTMSIFEL